MSFFVNAPHPVTTTRTLNKETGGLQHNFGCAAVIGLIKPVTTPHQKLYCAVLTNSFVAVEVKPSTELKIWLFTTKLNNIDKNWAQTCSSFAKHYQKIVERNGFHVQYQMSI